MPLYEYRCPQCGPFDLRRALEEASAPLSCPACTAAGPAGLHRSCYRRPDRPLSGAGAADRRRVDRALSGEPVVTGPPQGRRLPTGGHPH